MKAKAVIFPEKLKVTFCDVKVGDPGPCDVVVETYYSWISNGTEGSFLRGERLDGEIPYQQGDPQPFPIAAGYQSTGIVKAVGSEVTDILPGQWVFAVFGHIENMFLPYAGHVSPKISDSSWVIPLPEGVSPVAASGLVLTQVGYNCGMRAPVKVGDVALVIGDGLVGQWTAQTLYWRGATVILAGKHDERLKYFGGNNNKHTINISQDNIENTIKKITSQPVDVLVDTVGSIPTIMECMDLLRHNGHIVSAGFNGLDSLIDIQKLRLKELTLYSPSGMLPDRMNDTLSLIKSGHLLTEELITHKFPVEQADEAWQLILDRTEPVLGVILCWK